MNLWRSQATKRQSGKAAGDVLHKYILFQGVDAEVLVSLEMSAVRRRYGAGRVLFAQGTPAESLYCIESGQVRQSFLDSSGREVFLRDFETGDVMGENASCPDASSVTTAAIVRPTHLLVIPGHILRLHVRQDPILGLNLIGLFCRNLSLLSEFVQDNLFHSGDFRLAKHILQSVQDRAPNRAGAHAEISITQDDLAHFAGISRQMVNHYLREWNDAGWVELHHERLVVLEPEALDEIAMSSAEGQVSTT